MTTRVIDVGAAALLGDERHRSTVDPLIWASLLKALSAMGAYRREIGPQVEAGAMVNFVLREDSLPRSVKFCLNGIRKELVPLNNNQEALRLVNKARRKLSLFDPQVRSREELHIFIDQFQLILQASLQQHRPYLVHDRPEVSYVYSHRTGRPQMANKGGKHR